MNRQLYNIYCDESRVENKDSNKMVIGSLFLDRRKKNVVTRDMRDIFYRHDFCYELKWSKVGKKYAKLYEEIIDYFCTNEYLSFRAIIVDKRKVQFKRYHNGSLETAFYKFYYVMLKARLLDWNEYYIFLDEKPSRDRSVVTALRHFLEFYLSKNKKNCKIRHLQQYDSGDNALIQLSDFFTGLIGFACNNDDLDESAKGSIVQYFQNLIGSDDLCRTSSLNEGKYNILVWKPRNEKD